MTAEKAALLVLRVLERRDRVLRPGDGQQYVSATVVISVDPEAYLKPTTERGRRAPKTGRAVDDRKNLAGTTVLVLNGQKSGVSRRVCPATGSTRLHGNVQTVPMAGEPWTKSDIEILAIEYFRFLTAELAGQSVIKNDALRRAQSALPAHRTLHTWKDRCYRISEELWKRDLPYVSGWKPPGLVGQSPNSINVAAIIWEAIEPRALARVSSTADLGRIPNTGTGQTYMSDAERRKALEELAQNSLVDHFEALGWSVEYTHLTSPFDGRATKGAEVRYLEAKGTTSDGSAVLVTRGEVEWARAHPGQCIMGKNAHAASHPAITTDRVWANDKNTNMCRDSTAVKINAWTFRRRPVASSTMKPIWAKSI